jgi:hypothetical protein
VPIWTGICVIGELIALGGAPAISNVRLTVSPFEFTALQTTVIGKLFSSTPAVFSKAMFDLTTTIPAEAPDAK